MSIKLLASEKLSVAFGFFLEVHRWSLHFTIRNFHIGNTSVCASEADTLTKRDRQTETQILILIYL